MTGSTDERLNNRLPDTDREWSFGVSEAAFSAAPVPDWRAVEERAAANTLSSATDTPLIRADVGAGRSAPPPQRHIGKRGFLPLYQWEGYVEAVTDDGFRARLVPSNTEELNPTQVEFAEFDFDDLSNETDRELVSEGAVFYWTIGKSRNSAGTIQNASLLRFRRLPPPTARERQEAERRAEALSAQLVGNPDADASSPQAALSVELAAVRYSLTERQREILELLIEGDSELEIAQRLFVTRATVAVHVAQIYRKLGAGEREALTRLRGATSST